MDTLVVYFDYIKVLYKIFSKFIVATLKIYPNYFTIEIITNVI
jgi:hypothetical protein